MNQTSKFHAII